MKISSGMRQFHRWMAVVFTFIVAGIFITLGTGNEPVEWVYYLPLVPLALLTVTGLYMFALPYASRWRASRKGAIS